MSALIEPAEMGPAVVRLLAGFEAMYRGGCRHRDADQWARATDIRSACLACLGASASTAAWELRGPCDLCGRLLPTPPARTWAIPSKTNTTVAVRLCDQCSKEQVTAIGGADEEQEDA